MRTRLSRTRLSAALTAGLSAGAAIGLVVGLVVGGPAAVAQRPAAAAAPRAEVHAPVPSVDWGPCPDRVAYPGRVDCARVRAPLDYDDPTGASISLWLSRRPATGPHRPIGTLFTNPGGPGGSAADFVAYAGQLFPRHVKQHFDIVGIDPRGIGRSAGVRCRTGGPLPYPRVPYPITQPQVAHQIRFDQFVRDACADNGNAIVDHMTTADTARDMDLVRQALGEDQLNYYGISYGTYLGATYAAMFPDSIRTLAVDGVLDPVAWATGRRPHQFRRDPFSARLRSQTGAFDALIDAFGACDRVGRQRCPLAGHAEGTWRHMLRKLAAGPVHVHGFGQVRYQDLPSVTLGALYDRRSIRPLFALLEQLSQALLGRQHESRGLEPARRALHRSLLRQVVPGPYGGGSAADPWAIAHRGRVLLPAFESVACADSLNPARESAWNPAALRAETRGRWFGRVWTWASGACAGWPGDDSDAYRGPFRSETSAPVLVIGNLHDPATPYQGAVTVTDLFPRTRLLTLDDYGHAAFARSGCVDKRLSHYLVQRTLPPAGVVCRPEHPLFPK